LVFITVISIITCPVTTVLNALIIVAVKTKNQVRTKSNIALACLSSTDAVMGVIGLPLFSSWLIVELQGNTFGMHCELIGFTRTSLRLLTIASLLHLAIVNVERYIAIKHSLRYEIIVTEARLIGVSALLWTITLLLTFLPGNNYVQYDIGLTSLCIASIFSCQVVLYYETRRHEKKIALQQVSVEAREKFLREKKALKQTTTVIFFLIICYLPIIISRVFISTFAVLNSVNSVYFVHFTGVFFVISNSLLNPIIHCVRMKKFRLALKELVFSKGNIQAAN
ncbi:unnamed protein product, partial [Porites lobata]